MTYYPDGEQFANWQQEEGLTEERQSWIDEKFQGWQIDDRDVEGQQ